MLLTEKEFEEIKKSYGGKNYRIAGNWQGLPPPPPAKGILLNYFNVKNIELNYAFDPNMPPEAWQDYKIVEYKTEAKPWYLGMTFSPEPDEIIDKAMWLALLSDEAQNFQNGNVAKRVNSEELGYDSEKNPDFILKKAILALDVVNRYELWGKRMYAMFSAQNPKHAQFFLQTNYMSNMATMLSEAYNFLYKPDFNALDVNQREIWVKLMLYTADKEVTLSQTYRPQSTVYDLEARKQMHETIKNSGIPELIKMLPPEPKVEPSYLSQAASFLYGFLPGFRAKQNVADAPDEAQPLLADIVDEAKPLSAAEKAEVEKQAAKLSAKIKVLSRELETEMDLADVFTDKQSKKVDAIIGTLNKLIEYAEKNKIDIANNKEVILFLTMNFSKALTYLPKVPAGAADAQVLEDAIKTCDSFEGCYKKSASLGNKSIENDFALQSINKFREHFASNLLQARNRETKKFR